MATQTDDVTEITDLDVTKLAGVAAPANRAPFLLIKAKGSSGAKSDGAADDDTKTCPTCNGSGKIMEGHRQCPDCNGSGKVAADFEKSDSIEADEQEEEMTDEAAKAEADDIENLLTKQAHDEGAYCGDDTCEKCVIRDGNGMRLRPGVAPLTKAAQQSRAYWDAVTKKKMDPDVGGGVDRDKIPAEDFAGKNRSFPIVTPGDVSDAASSIGRAGDDNYPADKLKANIIAIAKRKGAKFVAELPKAWQDDAKKGQVQDGLNGTAAPEAAGVIDGSQSGVAGPATDGPKDVPTTVPEGREASSNSGVVAQLRGGESAYEIPAESRLGVINPSPDSGQLAVTKAAMLARVARALQAVEKERQARKDSNYLSVLGPAATDDSTPGSMPWESYDAATLDQVASTLAACCNAIEAIATREQIEALSGDAGDYQDAWDLQDAGQCLDYAMGVVARLAYAEGAEAAKSEGEADTTESVVEKAYRRLRAGDEKALRDAHAAITNVLAQHDQAAQKPSKGGGSKVVDAGQDEPSEGDKIQMELTKEELAGEIAASVQAALKAQQDEAKKAAKKADKKARKQAKKNANNGGDITAQQMQDAVGTEHDANDVECVGAATKPEYVNKSDDGSDSALKQITDQLEAVTKAVGSLGEQVQKIAKRPRQGGPVLDGQARGQFPAAEARMAEVSKGSGEDEASKLIKSLEDRFEQTTDPIAKQEIGYKLTFERLKQAHELGRI